ncbi:NAD(P)/FAD-dependent oxidoreductase [Luteolibacter luteus]|uniref:NAD(P)/FAD-dependent oxidoreductase n=1 Tax=Luteolibacter luteus TaxID=2728835 RepID=A0A858RIJ8_9BACT|nr:NAD(P)/FAD-dependent oxidoreductase [Luteolibacter luteus]QJE96249.1 NAD(P)/FAD-dependent oxidoreductase [Luteolibacter luteus]
MSTTDPVSPPLVSRRDVLNGLASMATVSSLYAASLEDADPDEIFELVIIGGGPAGLSAAMVMARARRRVLLIDGGTPRNAAAPAVHTFLTRDGVLPSDFRKIARGQLARYPSVAFREDLVASITGEPGAFEVTTASGGRIRTRYVLLTLGLVDELPAIPGLRENWGRGVHHCAFCDGYEHRDEPWGLLVEDPAVLEHVPFFLGWTANLTIFASGLSLPPEALSGLAGRGIKVESRKIRQLRPAGNLHSLEAALMEDGSAVLLSAFFVQPKQSQTPLVSALGLTLREDGAVLREETGETSRPGIFAAGDLSAGRMQQALLAAADGARVAYFLAKLSVEESLDR